MKYSLVDIVMKLRELPTPATTPVGGCEYSRKPFHKWELSFIDPRGSGVKDLERKCSDCGARQHVGGVPDAETRALPKTLWCVGDWQWQPGALEP
jgi:hypothetical protein